jgi:hypothetical protein
MQRFTEGWSRDDSTQVWNLLADSVALYGGRRPLVGTEAVRGWARRQMATEGAMRLTPLYEQARGDQGYQVGRWEFVDPKGGVPLQSGVHTFVLRRQPVVSWKIHTMFIVDDPSAPRAPTEQARIP